MSNRLETLKADQANFLDKTEDEVKTVASTVSSEAMNENPDLEAVAAFTAHVNKYDVREEDEASPE
ncbi:hypothetical protein FE782_11410 [Paenibacillus antri]|uniref:DUF4025 domain-containing protein n=1 Tax=Paenibacillus antri TaxID=2582848 RepID=A0A5R9G8C7_9BACL|nr:hypothetical protein [Paenibacillus antri]TLS51981.1 hypothetical protein FE782_11410 [Paenibacillus antri]